MSNHRAGLVVFDKVKRNLVVLERELPYNSKKKERVDIFVEKFSIPRGEVKKFEDMKLGAIREFIEEAKFFPKSITIKDDVFNLFWHDPKDTIWSYQIFFIECDLSYKNCINFDNGKQQKKPSIDPDMLNSISKLPIKLDLSNVKFSNMEKYSTRVMDLESYISKMHKILPCYGENNYIEFFNFLKKLM